MTTARKLVSGLIGGLVVGVIVLGIGGRIVMRLIALLAGEPPGFSIGGTLEVLAFAALIGAPSGLAFGIIRPYTPGNSWLKGSVFGMLVFLTVILLPGDAKNAAFAFPDLFPATVALFAALFIIHGVVLAAVMERAGRPKPTRAVMVGPDGQDHEEES